ncbi:hypothetical protein, partial [Pseudomonas protegens]|uniref:hypothetical protein n=1 Tax=Pseudomonas protegens TaxID=380021 RepID=UPI001C83A9D1
MSSAIQAAVSPAVAQSFIDSVNEYRWKQYDTLPITYDTTTLQTTAQQWAEKCVLVSDPTAESSNTMQNM